MPFAVSPCFSIITVQKETAKESARSSAELRVVVMMAVVTLGRRPEYLTPRFFAGIRASQCPSQSLESSLAVVRTDRNDVPTWLG